jgi:hypothetical protein
MAAHKAEEMPESPDSQAHVSGHLEGKGVVQVYPAHWRDPETTANSNSLQGWAGTW